LAEHSATSPPCGDPLPATFDNVIVGWNCPAGCCCGWQRVSNVTASATMTPLKAIELDMAPPGGHWNAIYLDAALFARIDTLYQSRAALGLDAGIDAGAGALSPGFRARRRQA